MPPAGQAGRLESVDVGQAMTRAVVTVGPETPLREVARILSERRISGLPVVDGAGALVGVVSGRDLLTRRDGARTAGEAMSSPAICIGAERPVWEAAQLMSARRVQRLPVRGRDGRLAGIVTRADLVRAFVRSDAEVAADLNLGLDVDVEVVRGEVTLRGVVAGRGAARDAERSAARVPGVVAVDSKLMWPQRTR